MPAERMNILVKNIPNGGAPVMAKNPIKKNIAVTGIALRAPLIEAILAEWYLSRKLPDRKKSADFMKE